MSKLGRFLLLFFLCVCVTPAQNWSGILSSSRATDWTKAGLPATLPDGETTPNAWTPPTRTQCGSTLTAPSSATAINAALVSCATGTYVKLGPGTFAASDAAVTIGNQNGVTLRGSGADQTRLLFSGPGDFMNWENGSTGTSSASWTAGYSQGTTSIMLTSAPGVDDLIVLYGVGPTLDNGGVWVCTDVSVCSSEGGNGGESENHIVTSVSGSGPYAVGISPPISFPAFATLSSLTGTWVHGGSYGDGLEDMTVENGGYFLGYTYASWIKGVRVVASGGSGGTGLISEKNSANVLYLNDYITQGLLSVPYELWTGDTDGYDLFLNNIISNGGMFEQEPGGVDVWAYNVDRDYSNTLTPNYVGNNMNNHTSGYANNLVEGNEMGAWYEDNIHGTSNLNTFFRNVFYGQDPPYVDVDNILDIYFGGVARFENAIGNVLGGASYNAYKCTSSSCANGVASGYVITVGNGLTGITDALSNTSAMFWGNYDTVHGAVQWNSAEVPTTLSGNATPYENAVPASHTLPASFFLNSIPSFWTVCTNYPTCSTSLTPAWPPIGPDVTSGNINGTGGFPNYAGFANHIPAYIAWKNLPIDTSYQVTYSITGSSWSSGTETLTVSGLPITPAGEFQVIGMTPSGCNGTFMMTSASGTQVQYAVASNLGCGNSGSFLFPDIRVFNESIYSSAGGPPVAPTGLMGTVQ